MKAINKTNLIGEAKKDFLVALSCDQCYKYYAKFVASVKTFLTYWAPLMWFGMDAIQIHNIHKTEIAIQQNNTFNGII